ncbi:histo-blood group ABO system transferase-like [Lissotriton helveticus]
MVWDADIYLLDILIFRSLVLAAAAFFICKYTSNATRWFLSILLCSLVLTVIFADSYVCRSWLLNIRRNGWGRVDLNCNFLEEQPVPATQEDRRDLICCCLEEPLPGIPSFNYEKPNMMKPARSEVMTVTPWLAPVVWTGTYNRGILNKDFERKNYTIGLTVFALGSYWKLLKRFLESADKFFMVGHKVIYYVYTDLLEKVECTTTQTDRKCKVYKMSTIDSKIRVFMKRMEMLQLHIKTKVIDVQYLVCADVDLVFHDEVGVEILGDLVATLHPDFYKYPRGGLTFERRESSQAYIPKTEGDFYYQANFFAGTPQEIYRLTKTCDQAIKTDDLKGIIAVFHDESHFNKYLLHHKPTKILSPEYVWRRDLHMQPEIKTVRIIHGEKNL